MPRDSHPFYAPPSAITADGSVRFPKEEARHILRVSRFGPGDRIRVVDGEGGLFGVVLEEGKEGLAGRVVEDRRLPAPAIALELGFPLLRQRARTEWMLEKAVEVGADRLVPITWERALPRGRTLPAAVRARWERILREAMKQCERLWLPVLAEPEDAVTRTERTMLVLADPAGEPEPPDARGCSRVRLLVGPEGGVTEAEMRELRAEGARLWSLGPTRLRAETAAIVGIARLEDHLRRSGSAPSSGRKGE
jgi:16S rRNA (uracil1498-N3)-methyltransferase